METGITAIRRPQRWDTPFDPTMTEEAVGRLMKVAPFSHMDEGAFSEALPLRGILRNDARIREFQPGDLIIREGDYGNSAFLILRGRVRVTLDSLPARMLGRTERPRRNWWRLLTQVFNGRRAPEARRVTAAAGDPSVGHRGQGGDVRIFLQDIPRILDQYETTNLTTGELFGEVAAMARTPYAATVFAEEPTAVLELRWQGLRDLMRRTPQLKQHVEQLYRKHSLETHLRETPLLKTLPPETIREIARATLFETYGEFEWQREFRRHLHEDPSLRIQQEPLVAEEGQYPDGLILVRAGFARLSQRYGHGHRTLAYLGKGQTFGMETLAYNWKQREQRPLPYSLRAAGFVDVLRVPTHAVERHILPQLSANQVASLLKQAEGQRHPGQEMAPSLSTNLLEFILDYRLMNGRQAMVIDLDRCTRCDDCVRACATAHDNNPRFVRQGPQFGRFQFASACMHCVDPVCMIGCPTGAIARDTSSGCVLINEQTCIGCSTCANSCPYQNIRMVGIRDDHGQFVLDDEKMQPVLKATKCDLCSGQWGGPACQRACPHDALVRIDMNHLAHARSWFAGRQHGMASPNGSADIDGATMG